MKKSIGIIFLCTAFTVAWAQPMAQPKMLTLDECVHIALGENPQIVQSQYYLKITGKDVLSSVSRFLPSVQADIGYNHSVVGPSSKLRVDPRTGIPVPVQPFEINSWSSRAGFDISQTLFNGSNFFNLSRYFSLKKSAEYDFDRTKQDVIFRVKERYYTLLKSQKLLEVQEETIKSSEASYKRAQVLYEVGKAPKSDVLKAKVLLEQSRLALIGAQNDLSVAKASLNHVLGFDVNAEIQVVDNAETLEPETNYEETYQNSMKNHPMVLKSKADVKASKAMIGAAAGQFMPSVSAYYGYSWRNEKFDRIKSMFDQDYNWYAGVSLSIPIFTGFSRVADISKAQLSYQSTQEALAQTEKDVALELKQAYFSVGQSKKKMTVTQDAETAAEEDLRLNKEKYNLGSGTMLDLINAQVSYTQSKSDRIQSLYDYKINMARLMKAMGKLDK